MSTTAWNFHDRISDTICPHQAMVSQLKFCNQFYDVEREKLGDARIHLKFVGSVKLAEQYLERSLII